MNMPLVLRDDKGDDLFEHLNDPVENTEEYSRLSASPADSFDLVGHIGFAYCRRNLELRLISNPQPEIAAEIVLLDHAEREILYFNRISKIRHPAISFGKPVTQTMIWRNFKSLDSGDESHGLTDKIFFGFILDKFDVILSDSEQTRDGRRMWEKLLNQAIRSSNMEAAIIDEANKYLILNNRKELHEAAKWLWGSESVHAERFGVIRKP